MVDEQKEDGGDSQAADELADAWATVLIDIHEKRKAGEVKEWTPAPGCPTADIAGGESNR